MNQVGLLFQDRELTSKNQKMYEWTFMVNGKKVKVVTNGKDQELAKLELAKAIGNAQRSTKGSWLALYYELEKTYKIECEKIVLL